MKSLTNIRVDDPRDVEAIESLREYAKEYGNAILDRLPVTRETAIALTNLEESLMWAVKALVLEARSE